jgi:hypothetical protein
MSSGQSASPAPAPGCVQRLRTGKVSPELASCVMRAVTLALNSAPPENALGETKTIIISLYPQYAELVHTPEFTAILGFEIARQDLADAD